MYNIACYMDVESKDIWEYAAVYVDDLSFVLRDPYEFVWFLKDK